jgi:hypothetical protein
VSTKRLGDDHDELEDHDDHDPFGKMPSSVEMLQSVVIVAIVVSFDTRDVPAGVE